MIITPTPILGVKIIQFPHHTDKRGSFSRIFCSKSFTKKQLNINFQQDSFSTTKVKGTIRGIHYQKKPYWEEKLVRCLKGSIYDIVVDMRPESPSFLQWLGITLSKQNNKALLLPKGTAHGFQTLTNDVIVHYKISESYTPKYSTGILWKDPTLLIKWPLKPSIISKNDSNLPTIKQILETTK